MQKQERTFRIHPQKPAQKLTAGQQAVDDQKIAFYTVQQEEKKELL